MKRRALIVAPEARDDLTSLYDWIANAASPDVALRYVERIERHLSGFDFVAERGTKRDDVRPGLRISGFERRVTIAFTVGPERVTILRILYGGRDWERDLSGDEHGA
ncbi:type II toxin-antitoxin system RelE/ParE family toxin [Methylobacterium sp. DB1607]|nr:type II toxin-antitoxin system RelE/ParE family toxin [Methylobacterium sp. DB1607]